MNFLHAEYLTHYYVFPHSTTRWSQIKRWLLNSDISVVRAGEGITAAPAQAGHGVMPAPPPGWPGALAHRPPPLCAWPGGSPDSLVGQPAGVTLVEAVLIGGLQLFRGGDDGTVL